MNAQQQAASLTNAAAILANLKGTPAIEEEARTLSGAARDLAATIEATGAEPKTESRTFFIALYSLMQSPAMDVLFDVMDKMDTADGFAQAGAVFGASSILYEIGNNGGINFERNKRWEMQFSRAGLTLPASFGKKGQHAIAATIYRKFPGLAEGIGWEGLDS